MIPHFPGSALTQQHHSSKLLHLFAPHLLDMLFCPPVHSVGHSANSAKALFQELCADGGRNRHTLSVQKESQFHLLNRLIVIRVS